MIETVASNWKSILAATAFAAVTNGINLQQFGLPARQEVGEQAALTMEAQSLVTTQAKEIAELQKLLRECQQQCG